MSTKTIRPAHPRNGIYVSVQTNGQFRFNVAGRNAFRNKQILCEYNPKTGLFYLQFVKIPSINSIPILVRGGGIDDSSQTVSATFSSQWYSRLLLRKYDGYPQQFELVKVSEDRYRLVIIPR